MDCAGCAVKVETAVGQLPGVSSTRVNFTTQKLSVEYDPRTTAPERFQSAVRPLGYAIQLPAPSIPEEAGRTGEAGGHGRAEEASTRPWHRTRQGRFVLFTGVLLAIAWAVDFVAPGFATWGFALATIVGVAPLARRAVAEARIGNPFSINTLVALASVGALLIGAAPEAAVVVFLFAVGELMEGVAAGRARAGVRALAALAPKTAHLVGQDGTTEVPVERLKIGDEVQVRPGGRVPADGTILTGTSSLDDSPVTGESVPVAKGPGDAVFAGSINTDGVLTARVNADASDNTISRIIHMVEEAQARKAPTARFIERFSRSYTPAVVAVSVLVMLVPPLLLGGAWHEWLYKGIALLLIGCPCALVLSVPAAITSGISAGARRGLLIKGGAALETIGSIATVAFDKTGTLTANTPRVTDLYAVDGDEGRLLALAAAVEQGSSHPLARAILDRAADLKLTVPASTGQQAIAGKAATASVEGRFLAVGSPRHAAELSPLTGDLQARVAALEEQGKTVVVLLEGTKPLGLITIRDEARADARDAIADLKRLGVQPLMLTGDNRRTGNAIAATLGLEARSELLPAGKLKLIGDLKQNGKVAMVGDGINDAPALAAADVGIAMGGGTDVALETADAALLGRGVQGVADLVKLSRATMGNIKQNIAFALGLKAIFLVTTLLGITSLWAAVLSDTGATFLVTANALRLLRFRPR
ncbi:MAG TPA: heavy metal translocating P-type ATPase [Deinococcales bacterium]|nr:heavy metal translocating P-type ATPase [Deinococcales bacterium]